MINTQIDNRYLIKSTLGVGGMAHVYLAEDLYHQRLVAIKIIKETIASDNSNKLRFEREARTIAALLHQNIVQIYDTGEYDGLPYIVMEYVKSATLKEQLIQRYFFSVKESVDIIRQLALALSHAHKNEVVHRDIKPQNILVKPDGTIKLGDFGIAIFENAPAITEIDMVMGSVHYMAPEVAYGEKASSYSDIYSLGITFFELLTGHVPYEGDNSSKILLKHINDPFPSVRKINKNIPKSVERIINKCCAKEKYNRYLSASELYNDLASLDLSKKEKTGIFSKIFKRKEK